VGNDDDVLAHAIEDIIRELEWEGPERWAPVIERLRRLVGDRRNESAPGQEETAADAEPSRQGPADRQS
jgi:hypothetical protein